MSRLLLLLVILVIQSLILSARIISIITPSNQIIYSDVITISGKKTYQENDLFINQQHFSLKAGKYFKIEYPLNVGQNKLNITNGNEVIIAKMKILRLSTYQDIPPEHWFRESLGLLNASQIISYKTILNPLSLVTRQEVANIIYNAFSTKLVKPTDQIYIKDISFTDDDYPKINILLKNKILSLYPDGSFHPGEYITKYQLLIIMLRLEDISISKDISISFQFPFKDIKSSGFFARLLQLGLNYNLISPENTFQGETIVNRLTFLAFISKLSHVKFNLKKLKFFEEGADNE